MNYTKSYIFDDYINCFKKLSIKDKKLKTIDELKKLLIFVDTAIQNSGGQSKIILNKEMNDLDNVNSTDDDFAEAVFAYVKSLQELVAYFVEQTMEEN